MSTLLEKVKANLILDHSEDDELLQRLIDAAVAYAESYQHLTTGTYEAAAMPATTEQAVIMLASHFYESRDGSTGGFFADKARLETDLERVFTLFPRLKERCNQRGGTLSGGEQQMLAIGRGLMSRPNLLLLDEPSLGLAPIIIAQIFQILKEIREEGVTIFLVEQNAHRALQLADRGYVLENGRIVLADTGANLLANDQVRKAYLGG